MQQTDLDDHRGFRDGALCSGRCVIPVAEEDEIRPDDLRPRAGIPQEKAGHAHHGRHHLRHSGADRRGGVRHLRRNDTGNGTVLLMVVICALGFGAHRLCGRFHQGQAQAFAGPDPQAEADSADRAVGGAGGLAPIGRQEIGSGLTVPFFDCGVGSGLGIHPGDDLRAGGHGEFGQPAGRPGRPAGRAARCSISLPWR